MPATLTYTRRPLWHRICRQVRIWMLVYEISSAEQWIEQCRKAGIVSSNSLEELRRHVWKLEVLLACVEAS